MFQMPFLCYLFPPKGAISLNSRCWFLVPARGGSRGLPRKNVLMLGGKPLIGHVLGTLTSAWNPSDVVVATDDGEIADIAEGYGVRIMHEALATGQNTLDDVALETCKAFFAEDRYRADKLITVQPTCPFVAVETIKACIAKLEQGSRTVLTVSDDRHLRWGLGDDDQPVPLYEKRLNRQLLKPVYRETGGVVGAFIGDILASGTRIQRKGVALVEVDRREAVDIDLYQDFLVAESYARRRNVLIRADGSRNLGTGHIQRALALAIQLAGYGIEIVTRADGDYELGHRLLAKHPFQLRTIDNEKSFFAIAEKSRPDAIFLDILDTDAETIKLLHGFSQKIVTFEDLGEGAQGADLVINDLYPNPDPPANTLTGVENALLSNAFDHVRPRCDVNPRVERLLVVFGGSDPSNLTEKTLQAIADAKFEGNVTLVIGPGRAHRSLTLGDFGLKGEVLVNVSDMAKVMSRADFAISSAGRTVTELMTVGIPTLVLCQNARELLHTHASMPYGVMNLGLGSLVDPKTLRDTLCFLMEHKEIRAQMNASMLKATARRDNRKIVRRIESALGWE